MTSNTLKALFFLTVLMSLGSAGFSNACAADEESAALLENIQSTIEKQNKTIASFKQRIKEQGGILKEASETRLDKEWMQLIETNLAFVESVVGQEKSGVDVGKYRKQAIEILNAQDEINVMFATRIKSRITLPEQGLSAADLAAAHAKLFILVDYLNRNDKLFIRSLELAKYFKIDVTEKTTLLKNTLEERATNGSIMLEVAMLDVVVSQARADVMPDDKELKALLNVNSDYVRYLADKLAAVLVMMEKLEMDTSDYQKQLMSATGQITTKIFSLSVMNELLIGWWQLIWNVILEGGPDLLFKAFLFIIIIYVFYKLACIVQKLIEKGFAKSHLQPSKLLQRMTLSIVRNIIIALGLLIALSQVGVSLGPLLAGLGVIGFVIGFSLQDSLSNFAAGIMILIYRPFDVGDLIETCGEYGRVNKMSLVCTTILTLDNQTIIIPNNKIWGDVVKNVTAQTVRRVDMIFGISYSDDIEKTEQVLQKILDSHEKVLTDPKPMVRLHELGDSSVNFAVRPWVKKDDYWDVYWDITRSVKMRFDEEGISIPFPQRDVHIDNQNVVIPL